MSAHPRPLELERFAAGEPVAIEEHVLSCDACRAVVTELREATRAYVARHPVQQLHAAADERRHAWWRRWWPLALVPVAVALALTLRTPEVPETRLKGGALTLFVTRGETTTELADDGRVRPGDLLTFTFVATGDGHLLVLDVERGKGASVISAQPIAKGVTARSSRAFELDGTEADEWLVAVLSPGPLGPDAVRVDEAGPHVDCEGCTVEVHALVRAR
jgi:hypothetical protein